MTTKIYKQLGGTQDLAIGAGQQSQSRNGNTIIIDEVNIGVYADTLQLAVNDSSMYEGAVVLIKERVTGEANGGIWDAVLSSSIVTNFNDIIQCIGNPLLALVRRESKQIDLANQSAGYLLNELDLSSLGIVPERVSQGIAVNSRTNKLYLYQRTAGSTDKVDERFRIIEFDLSSDGSTITPTDNTIELASGHQGISVQYKPASNDVYLWTKGSPHLANTTDNEQAGKHVFRWDYKGNLTTQTDAKRYHLFPDYGSTDSLEEFYNLTPCVSIDERYLVVKVSRYNENSTDQRVFVYNLAVIESYTNLQIEDPANFNRSSDAYIADWPLSRVQLRTNNFTQGISCDGARVYLHCGGPDLNGLQDTVVYTLGGKLISRYDHFLGNPANNPSPPSGTLILWEPEGGAILTKENSEIITIIDSSWDDAGTNRVVHQVWGLRETNQEAVNVNTDAENGTDIYFKGGVPREMLMNEGEIISIDVLEDATNGQARKAFALANDGSIRLYQTNDTDVSTGSRVRRSVGVDRSSLELRGNTGLADGAAINIYGNDDSVRPTSITIWTQGDVANPDLILDDNGRLILGKRGELKLINVEGSESNIYKSNSSGRRILEIRGATSLTNGAGINLYGESDPTNPGRLFLTAGPSGDIILDGLPTVSPAVTGAIWNDSGILRIS